MLPSPVICPASLIALALLSIHPLAGSDGIQRRIQIGHLTLTVAKDKCVLEATGDVGKARHLPAAVDGSAEAGDDVGSAKVSQISDTITNRSGPGSTGCRQG